MAATDLTGRGGGHFPAARKWQTVLDATRRTGLLPVVVGNASEGEPASAKDAALLVHRPHLVLDGLAHAAEAVGATESVVWLHGDAHEPHRVLVRALQERRSAGLVEPPVRLATGPSRYLTGESNAVVQRAVRRAGGARVAPRADRGPRRRRPPDARAQRRDAGPHRAGRPVRGRGAPADEPGHRAGRGAAHRARAGGRDAGERGPAARWLAGGRGPAGCARRRVRRQLAALGAGQGPAARRGIAAGCRGVARLRACWRRWVPRCAGSPRWRGSRPTWPGPVPGSAGPACSAWRRSRPR